MQDPVSDVCAEIYVSGRVQGVFFRQFTHDAATRLEVSGYAQNLPDGRVKVIAQGNRASVDRLVDQLRIGPKFANVEKLDVKWCEPSGAFAGFHIRR